MDSKVGVIGALSLLLVSGAIYTLEIDKTYICSSDNTIAVFDKISSTGITGYWVDEEGKNRQKICSGGKWVKYTSDKLPPQNPKSWLCSSDGCKPKDI